MNARDVIVISTIVLAIFGVGYIAMSTFEDDDNYDEYYGKNDF